MRDIERYRTAAQLKRARARQVQVYGEENIYPEAVTARAKQRGTMIAPSVDLPAISSAALLVNS